METIEKPIQSLSQSTFQMFSQTKTRAELVFMMLNQRELL